MIAGLHESVVGEAVEGVFLQPAHKRGRIGVEQVHLVRGNDLSGFPREDRLTER